jgi:hypothetical protein
MASPGWAVVRMDERGAGAGSAGGWAIWPNNTADAVALRCGNPCGRQAKAAPVPGFAAKI